MLSMIAPEHSGEKCSNICDFCRVEIFEAERLWDRHHSSFQELELSAESQCIFCSTILHAITSRFSDITRAQLPLYRWNIRRLAQIRDTLEIVSVVFRPLNDQQTLVTLNGERTLPDITFHLYREHDIDHVIEGPDLGPSTNSAETLTQISKWIDDCQQNHPKCRPLEQLEKLLPTRLLDIGQIDATGQNSGSMHVVDTRVQTITGPYVTLSHSWGTNPQFLSMQAENERKLMTEGIRLDDPGISRNFKEAIMVARSLDIQYIWMDSICILQNSDDFQKEAPFMHQYYRHSFCNIGASASRQANEGLFRYRKSAKDDNQPMTARYVPQVYTTTFGHHRWIAMAADTWETQLLQNPLYLRGWVFQERMLAPRMLHFSKSQVFFECATISACESLPTGFPRTSGGRAARDRHWRERLQLGPCLSVRPAFGAADFSVEEFWQIAVNTYTRCDLTNRADKIVAFQGFANLVRQALPDEEFGYGLWTKRLEEQLAWRVYHCRQANGDPSVRLKPLRFPSWSWASVTGIIEVQDRLPPVPRQYTVCNHDGGPLGFELADTEVVVAVPDSVRKQDEPQPSASFNNEPNNPVTQPNGATDTTSENLAATESLLLEHPAINIQGYVRDGYLQWNDKQIAYELYSTDSEDLKCEVFPDEPSKEGIKHCSFIVLAYSVILGTGDGKRSSLQSIRTTRQRSSLQRRDVGSEAAFESTSPPLFTGLGLILDRIKPNHYYRLGSIHFHGLTLGELATLTAPPQGVGVRFEADANEQAQNIFLH